MNTLLVHKPGPLTTIQDAGRPGLRRYGIPTSGAMDQFSCRIANALVSNRLDAAALEITLAGLILEATAEVVVAITGGDLTAQRNGEPAPLWTTVTLTRGDRLSFQKHVNGCRAYLAVRGGFEAAEFLGSKSTFAKGRMGAPLKAGDTVSTGRLLRPPAPVSRTLPLHLRPVLALPTTIRVIPGPQSDYFTSRGMETFLQSTYSMSPRSDRQGIRTEGPPIEIAKGPDIISDPTPLGAIQVPGDGKPIILHRDGQVTGGYAKIGKVIAVDLDKFGQMMPGDLIRFQSVTRDEALTIADEAQRQMQVIISMIEG